MEIEDVSQYKPDVKKLVQKSSAPKKIASIQFGTLLTDDIEKISEFRVTSQDLIEQPTRTAAQNGCLDPRLGISDKRSICQTCKKGLAECAGHFGYIRLELPVFHVGFFKHTLTILQCVCKNCSRCLLPIPERETYLKRLRNPNIDSVHRASHFKKIVELCKRSLICGFCNTANGAVKKVGGGCLKIVHEKSTKRVEDKIREDAIIHTIIKKNSELKDAKKNKKPSEVLNPVRAYDILMKITEEDASLLWMNSKYGRADSLVMWAVPVTPVPIRPSVPVEVGGGGTTEDDLTMKLQEIVVVNNALKMALDKGATMKMIAEDWEFLQVQVAQYINGETQGIPRALMAAKPIRGLCQRLKGKQGRFRGNLSGKRVDFSARTVISPDPNLRVDQVGVPVQVAKIMTYPEKVNKYNINRLQYLVKNGPDIHPGANMIRCENGTARTLMYGDRNKSAASLRYGDTVERHMIDDDIVLFNRQPSLHKMSIMAHRVKVMPWRTFRFNECACTPYNADFDGDEMNMHLPQTEEARAEAAELMSITNNLITPRNGEPLVAATQDFLTGAFLLTHKDVFLTKSEFCRLVAYLGDALDHIDLPLPVIFKPRQLWTGKQVISMLICPNKQATSRVNVESTEKFYTKNKHMCIADGYVLIRDGDLLCGCLGKKTLGGESKKGLFYVLIRDFGSSEATRCMNRLAKLCARYLGDRGFSIGIDDVTPSQKLINLKEKIMKNGDRDSLSSIEAYRNGNIRLKPGCDALQSLESELNGLLGKIRQKCGEEAMNALGVTNSPYIMANCGSKGSSLNISQMISCLGQQSVGGARIQNGFVNRTLPHFQVDALTPPAKGFVANSFYSGLTATEFFFHTMGGREGLVDTAVKTAETGYMARRLMKALEDLSMQYDMTVRNSEQTVVQFNYGDDGLNPHIMEGDDRPVEYNRLLLNTQSNYKCTEETGLGSMDLTLLMNTTLESDKFKSLLPAGALFIEETQRFFNKMIDSLKMLEALAVEKFDSKLKNVPSIKIGDLRYRLANMTAAKKKAWRSNALIDGTQEQFEMYNLLRENVVRITPTQFHRVIERALMKYRQSVIEPGEAVGAIGAQSLSEPGTQMTLKTFHFAGVASMNVTLGVPRLKEIINASKAISTPIIEARLIQDDSMTSARIVKAQIEKTTLGEIAQYIKEVHKPHMSYISVKLDRNAIQNLHLNVDSETVRNAILSSTGTVRASVIRGLESKQIQLVGTQHNKLRIFPPELKKESKMGISNEQRLYFQIQALKTALPGIIVRGIHSISRAIINEEQNIEGKKTYYLLLEGYGLAEVMGSSGIDGTSVKSNHIIDMQQVLGIEAARTVISLEIKYIMSQYGIKVDCRHLMLLSDVMTFKGEILGITRFGVAKMRESVLMLASFEKTTDHLFDAAVHSRRDDIVGVSECIIMGVPIPLGTGLFKLLHKPAIPPVVEKKKLCFSESLSLEVGM